MTHLVLVEDDERMGGLLKFFLEGKGFQVRWEKNGPAGLQAIHEHAPDLVILDLMLPGYDGMEVCRRVRPTYAGPILMLTASQADVNEISALDLGIDDYLTKPFRKRVLEARIRALLRRASAPATTQIAAQGPPDLVFGDLRLAVGQREALLDGAPLQLTEAEFELLWLLARRAGEVTPRDEIYAALKGGHYQNFDRAIDMRISVLRKKLDDATAPYRFIKTVRGKGYLFSAGPYG